MTEDDGACYGLTHIDERLVFFELYLHASGIVDFEIDNERW